MNKIEAILEEHIHHFLQDIKKEKDGDREALKIIRNYIRGEKISEGDDKILKTQLMDSLKIVGIAIPFVLIPGASLLMPLIIRVASKHHIDLMPSAFSNPGNTPSVS